MIRSLRTRLFTWEWLLAALVLILLVYSSLYTDGFATEFNISSSLSQMSEKALMVLPLVLLIVAREIDISVASIAGLCGVVAGMTIAGGGSVTQAVLIAVVVGAVCGAINGFFVAFLGLPSLIVTLGTLALFRGMCYVLLGGIPITDIPLELISFGNDVVPGTFIPLDLVPFILLSPLFAVALHRTPAGRRIYAIGGNPQTALYSGVKLRRIRFILFVISGLLCSIAGLIYVGRTGQASPDGALGFELDAITVVFLGGVSVLGGKGKMSGVLWALILIVILRSSLQLQGASGYTQGTAVGLLLILSLLGTNIMHKAAAALHDRRERRRRLDPKPPASLPTTTSATP